MKRTITVLITVIAMAMLLSASAVCSAEDAAGYDDVKSTRWSYPDIMYATEKGYMNGVGNNMFSPSGTMNRAMVATVLYRLNGAPETEYTGSFSDVPDGTWYSRSVSWAEKKGIVNGVGNGKFDPSGTITREQLVTMIYRYCDMKVYDISCRADLSGYSDSGKVSSYAADSFEWAVGTGIISGMDEDTLSPKTGATREQFAVILRRFDNTGFTVKDYETAKYKNIKYLVRYPDGYERGDKCPLLVFLHGSGTLGSTLENFYNTHPFFSDTDKVENYPFITLAPVIEAGTDWVGTDVLLGRLIEEYVSENNVDESRIYLMGVSLGGQGSFHMAAYMKDYFAAVVPISGWGETGEAQDMTGTPIRAYHGVLDDAVPYQATADLIKLIQDLGGDAELISYPDADHGLCLSLYYDQSVYEWMLEHVRTSD